MDEAWGPGRQVPRLLASLPCEDAAISQGVGDGRVTLQRVFFNLYANAFPAGFNRMTVVNFWTGGEGSYRAAVRLVAPNGAEVANGEAEIRGIPALGTAVQVIYFPNLVLPEPGKYTVEVLLDDAVVHTYNLHVVTTGEEEAEDEQS